MICQLKNFFSTYFSYESFFLNFYFYATVQLPELHLQRGVVKIYRTLIRAQPMPAKSVEDFLERLVREYPDLSRQLKLIGDHIEKNREHVGLERIQDVADQCNVQPSAVVRFAKHFGFSGFSEMQSLFRSNISTQLAPTKSYQKRIRDAVSSDMPPMNSAKIAEEFVGGAMAGLEELRRQLADLPIDAAVTILSKSAAFWVVGARRAYPVAAYLAYAFQHTDRPVHLLDFTGAMQIGRLRGLRKGEVVVAISFAPYAEETMLVARQASKIGAKVIAITDSRMNDLAKIADISLIAQEGAVFGFRALSSAMVLAQSLFIALAYKLELEYRPNVGVPV
jgi:DNA-binding MurR/RpiR family transcriptional regulator